MADEHITQLALLEDARVFKVPARTSAAGYKAEEWDLANPIWTGRVRVSGQGVKIIVELINLDGKIFATCSYDATGTSAVERVIDSSRYYVLRIEHSGRYAFIGLGWDERPAAFDFSVALQDQTKYVLNQKKMDEDAKNPTPLPDLNLKFREGEEIKLNIKTKTGAAGATSGRRSKGTATGSGAVFLPPPPRSTSTKTSSAPAANPFATASPFAPSTAASPFAPAPAAYTGATPNLFASPAPSPFATGPSPPASSTASLLFGAPTPTGAAGFGSPFSGTTSGWPAASPAPSPFASGGFSGSAAGGFASFPTTAAFPTTVSGSAAFTTSAPTASSPYASPGQPRTTPYPGTSGAPSWSM
eukprot:TRINITY_DN1721_c0_g1_i5.p1 TRINITY_DN1721_c0_g1~~TRINITY_DN1721_c0_g1_i5.p1  ORF type:complete len:358 (-),score=8.95 TRINITY_DN1721_c0_g1_i5:864-1937(-)